MTYSYNQHGDNESYYKIQRSKWIVYGCDELMLQDCISKKLILVNISFNSGFNLSKPFPTIQTFNKLLLACIASSINRSLQ